MQQLTAKWLAGALMAASLGLVSVSPVQADECPLSGSFSEWGSNSSGVVLVRPGESCLFGLRIAGEFKASKIVAEPQNGTLRRENISTFVYQPKAGFTGVDRFSVEVSGVGPRSSGTSVISMEARVQ